MSSDEGCCLPSTERDVPSDGAGLAARVVMGYWSAGALSPLSDPALASATQTAADYTFPTALAAPVPALCSGTGTVDRGYKSEDTIPPVSTGSLQPFYMPGAKCSWQVEGIGAARATACPSRVRESHALVAGRSFSPRTPGNLRSSSSPGDSWAPPPSP